MMNRFLAVLLLAGCAGHVEHDFPRAHGSVTASRGERALAVLDGGMSDCPALAANVHTMVTTYCVACHGNGAVNGNFGDVLSVPKMVASGRIVPGDPEASKVYMLVSTGVMPLTANKPSVGQIMDLRDWIECGAVDWNAEMMPMMPMAGMDAPDPVDAGMPATDASTPPPMPVFYSLRDRLGWMRDDLRTILNPAERAQVRYIDFTALANDGLSAAKIAAYKQAITFVANSLSFGQDVTKPIDVGPQKLVVRIDLRWFRWNAATWDQIVDGYPYAVRYDDAASRLYLFDEEFANDLRADTGTNIPYILADWFLYHVTQPPKYYQILGVGNDVAAFERDVIGVDVAGDIAAQLIERSGFAVSGVSVHNRIIERHALNGGGAFWTTYDFVNDLDTKNVFAHPLDFQHDAGESIFHLPNGLFGFTLQNAQNARLDAGDPQIVNDPNLRNRLITPAISCMGGCHLDGLIPKSDEVGLRAFFTAASAQERIGVLAVYPPSDALLSDTMADNARYLAAVKKTGIATKGGRTLLDLYKKHEAVVDIGVAASTIGIPPDELVAAFNAYAGAFPPEALNLRATAGSVSRETWDATFPVIVKGLGLGTPEAEVAP